ncbi:MAG: hypothetical protein JNK46_19195 [Methylobacteriaceae bacterium]|nr:hypothetical protein [Methylobacteriaceae bacterium]
MASDRDSRIIAFAKIAQFAAVALFMFAVVGYGLVTGDLLVARGRRTSFADDAPFFLLVMAVELALGLGAGWLAWRGWKDQRGSGG